MPEFCQKEKRVGLHSAVFRELVLGPKGLGPTLWRKAAGTAKVRLSVNIRRISKKRFIGRTAPHSGWRRSLGVHQKSTICRDVAPNLSDPMVAVPAIVSIGSKARNGKVAEMVTSEPAVVPDRDGHTMSSSSSPSTQSDRGSHILAPSCGTEGHSRSPRNATREHHSSVVTDGGCARLAGAACPPDRSYSRGVLHSRRDGMIAPHTNA